MDEQLRELSLDDLSYVGGGETTVEVSSGGFWSTVLGTVTGWLSSGETSQTALNANTGIRG